MYKVTKVTAKDADHLQELIGLLKTDFKGAASAKKSMGDDNQLEVKSSAPSFLFPFKRKEEKKLRKLGYLVQDQTVHTV